MYVCMYRAGEEIEQPVRLQHVARRPLDLDRTLRGYVPLRNFGELRFMTGGSEKISSS